MKNAIRITNTDNVAVALTDIRAGDDALGAPARAAIRRGHKIALSDIQAGENVIKYGYPIGHATAGIQKGEHVHTHNLKTNLKGLLEYAYKPSAIPVPMKRREVFWGYPRGDGSVGIRNEVWIVNTVGCVNQVAETLARKANLLYAGETDGVYAFAHPFGCSQLGDDQRNTQKILKGMVNHPNAGGVLVLGLGCENNRIPLFKEFLGGFDTGRVKFLEAQESGDEIADGLALIGELVEYAKGAKRERVSAEKLVIGLKCGGSDGLSGITANPLVGRVSDILVACGGMTVLTEVPEMFGAETILMDRAKDEGVFRDVVRMVDDFKRYFLRYNQEIYENPSPGNRDGGITTLEDKSLGCVQKGGASGVNAVLAYGDTATAPGLNLLYGPGNDIVAITALMAAGAHIILFTTGRGTPVGAPVPTMKIATNTPLAEKKACWIDFDAGRLLGDAGMDGLAEELFGKILRRIASGEERAKNETNGYREISIFKDGVTL